MVAVRPASRRLGRALPFVLAAGAFWFSLWSAFSSGLDAPLGLAPAAVPLAAWAGYLALRRQQAPEPSRELAFDGTVAMVLIAAALWFVWGEPNTLGWQYWSERHDLLAFELFALGAACLTLGVSTVWR